MFSKQLHSSRSHYEIMTIKNRTENLDYTLKILGTKEINKAEKFSV